MKKLIQKILLGEHSLFRLSLPFRVRLFNVLALVGGIISLVNGILSYVNNQDFIILGVNLATAILSFLLLFYAYKSENYPFCYVVTIVLIFMVMFPYLFFKSGGYKGGMISFYIFGILFTVFMLEGKTMFLAAIAEMLLYSITILVAYKNPQTVTWFSTEKEMVLDLFTGFCAATLSLAAAMYLHFRMYNKQQLILEEAKVEAQAANKAKSAFLANMSHEIRTPINVMLGMNEMIYRESENEEIRQYAKSIERSGEYLLSLINNVLDISRIESGKMDIEENRYELSQLLEELLLIGEKQAEQKGLQIYLACEESLPDCLIGDVIHIKQILLNLINNAIKYTNAGQITITVSKKEQGKQKWIIFEVKDTGIGIKEENLCILFDSFTRIDYKKNQRIEGTGLGLAIAKQLTEQMGGIIRVESVYGKGSSFFVELPLKEASDKKMQSSIQRKNTPKQQKSFVAPNAKILVVDDNMENLMVMKSLLKRTAISVDFALSGTECIKKVRENLYDLILLDYMMPQMDGIDTIKELKKDPQFHLPVIALSADITKGIEQTFLKEGFCAYLSKPVMWSKLEELLIRYLRKDLVFIQQANTDSPPISDEAILQLKKELEQKDISIEKGLKLLSGDFTQYQKLMEFFAEYQEEQMKQMDYLMQQKEELSVYDLTRIMHTLKSNAKAIGAMNLYEIAKEFEYRWKRNDLEYILSGYPLLKFEWNRVLHTAKIFLETTQHMTSTKPNAPEKQQICSKEETKEKLKLLLMRYQAKEAKEQLQYLLQNETDKNIQNILNNMLSAIDQLDFDEAEILMKRLEDMWNERK